MLVVQPLRDPDILLLFILGVNTGQQSLLISTWLQYNESFDISLVLKIVDYFSLREQIFNSLHIAKLIGLDALTLTGQLHDGVFLRFIRWTKFPSPPLKQNIVLCAQLAPKFIGYKDCFLNSIFLNIKLLLFTQTIQVTFRLWPILFSMNILDILRWTSTLQVKFLIKTSSLSLMFPPISRMLISSPR